MHVDRPALLGARASLDTVITKLGSREYGTALEGVTNL